MNFKLPFPDIYPIILEAIQLNTQAYLVGGCVRDLLLGREPQDIDLALSGDVKKVSRKLANFFDGAVYSLDDERETMRVMLETDQRNWKLDIARLRGGDLGEDLTTRDFTINAMAIEILPDGVYKIIDPLDGQHALNSRVVEVCSATSISDDPIRILRAARLALTLDFNLSQDVQMQMQHAVALMVNISGERQRDEVFKLLELEDASIAFYQFKELNIFSVLFPLFDEDRLSFSLELEKLFKEELLVETKTREYLETVLVEERTIIALLKISSMIKEEPNINGSVCQHYALSNREKVFLERVKAGLVFLKNISEHPKDMKPVDIYRYYRQTKEAGVGACLIAPALYGTEKVDSYCNQLISAFFDEYRRYFLVIPILDGNDLIRSFHLQPGPKFKELLESLKEAQVAGVVTSKSEAERFIQQQLS